jgi:uncharacterized protein (TIGR03084 family)
MLRSVSDTEPVLADLRAQHDELAAMLHGLDTEAWAAPTPCEGWDVADVVLHLAQTDELALASVQDRFADALDELTRGLAAATGVDEGADAMVRAQRGQPHQELHDRWEAGAAALRAALAGCDLSTPVTWVAGRLTARTLATTRLAEAWIHGVDIATAVGLEIAPTDRLRHIARLAWRTLPYAFANAGRELSAPIAFELTGPAGDTWTFAPDDDDAATVIRGDALDLCLVAGRRADPATTSLRGDGPDTDAVLELVRTYA